MFLITYVIFYIMIFEADAKYILITRLTDIFIHVIENANDWRII